MGPKLSFFAIILSPIYHQKFISSMQINIQNNVLKKISFSLQNNYGLEEDIFCSKTLDPNIKTNLKRNNLNTTLVMSGLVTVQTSVQPDIFHAEPEYYCSLRVPVKLDRV